MRLQFWLTLIFVLLIRSVADEYNRQFDTTVEFTAFVNWSGKKLKKCLKTDVHFLMDGNSQQIRLENLWVFDENDNNWQDKVFTEETEEILGYRVGFKNLKNGQIRLSKVDQREKEWSKLLKRLILGLFHFQTDSSENGRTQVTLKTGDQDSDFTQSKLSIQGFQPSTTTTPIDSERCTRARTAPVKYADLSCSNVGDTTLFTVKQFDTAKDKLKKKKVIPQREYDTNSELVCRPYLKQFAEEYDRDVDHDFDFGKQALETITQTYDEYRHQGSVYYNYFLMRESVIKAAGDQLTFQQFLRAIFYEGKGTGMRVFQHLKAAFEKKDFGNGDLPKSDSDPDTNSPPDSAGRSKRDLDDDEKEYVEEEEEEVANNEDLVAVSGNDDATTEEKEAKLNMILEEWRNGFGIITYKVIDNILSAEAFTFEAIFIDGYGNKKHGGSLTNLVRGHYGKQNPTFAEWFTEDVGELAGTKQVEKVASFLYMRAYNAFKHQRNRPVYPHDIKHMKI